MEIVIRDINDWSAVNKDPRDRLDLIFIISATIVVGNSKQEFIGHCHRCINIYLQFKYYNKTIIIVRGGS
jgi:hypothetical protein